MRLVLPFYKTKNSDLDSLLLFHVKLFQGYMQVDLCIWRGFNFFIYLSGNALDVKLEKIHFVIFRLLDSIITCAYHQLQAKIGKTHIVQIKY